MKVKLKPILIFSFILIIIVFAYIVFSPIIFKTVHLKAILYSIGKFMGMLGFLSLSILVISGDFARHLDRFIGIDKIIKFQRKFALISTVIVLLHPIFFKLSGLPFAFVLIPSAKAIPLAFGIISLYLFIIIEICSRLYKRISYNSWQFIHILIYVLFMFVLYHAINNGSDAGSIFLRVLYLTAFVLFVIGIILRTSYKIKQRKNRFVVQDVKWNTKNTFTVTIKPSKEFYFKAGQFCFLRLNKDNLYARHPFTISSSPDEEVLRFTIKQSGRFTEATSRLKKGEEVKIEGPFGRFTIEDNSKNLVFIAGGVGITPFMSILNEIFNRKNNLQDNKNKHKMILLYGSKTKQDIIFKEEIDKIKNKCFSKVYVLSRNKNQKEKGYWLGYINEEIIKKYAKKQGIELKDALFYICGPEPMKQSINQILSQLGVDNSSIFIEDFFW